jgi:tetratricopeptide (TPR) repeat protein
MLVHHSSYTMAFDSFDAANRLYRSLKEERPLAECLLASGTANAAYSRFDIAVDELSESLSIYTSLADRHGICACLDALGSTAYQSEDYEGAVAWYTRARTMQADAGRTVEAARCSLFLSSTLAACQDFAAAHAHYQDALRQLRHGSFAEMAEILADVGTDPFEDQDEAGINDLLNAALTFCSALTETMAHATDAVPTDGPHADPLDADYQQPEVARRNTWLAEMSALLQLSPIAYRQSRSELARELSEQALVLAEKHGGEQADELKLHVLHQAGVAALDNCDLPFARNDFEALIQIAGAMPADSEASTYLPLGHFGNARAALLQHDLEAAAEGISAALELFKKSASLKNVGRCLNLYGQIEAEKGSTDTAIKLLKEAVTLARKSDDTDGASAALTALSAVASEVDPEYAAHTLETVLSTEPIEAHTACRASGAMAELQVLRGSYDEAYVFAMKALQDAISNEDIVTLPSILETCGHIACFWGDIEIATILYARADLLRDRYGLPRGRRFDARYETDHTALREDMGESDFEAARTQGLTMDITELQEEAASLLSGATDVEEESEDQDEDDSGAIV